MPSVWQSGTSRRRANHDSSPGHGTSRTLMSKSSAGLGSDPTQLRGRRDRRPAYDKPKADGPVLRRLDLSLVKPSSNCRVSSQNSARQTGQLEWPMWNQVARH